MTNQNQNTHHDSAADSTSEPFDDQANSHGHPVIRNWMEDNSAVETHRQNDVTDSDLRSDFSDAREGHDYRDLHDAREARAEVSASQISASTEQPDQPDDGEGGEERSWFQRAKNFLFSLKGLLWLAVIAGLALFSYFGNQRFNQAEKPTEAVSTATPTPALTVEVTQMSPYEWVDQIQLDGQIQAGNEVSVTTKVSGLRILTVNPNIKIGGLVNKGERLMYLEATQYLDQIFQNTAQTQDARLALDSAIATHEKAKRLNVKGAVSAQQVRTYQEIVDAARARLDSAMASQNTSAYNLAGLQRVSPNGTEYALLAPVTGIVSARTVTSGGVSQAGMELFKIIENSVMEWHADVPTQHLSEIKVGQKVELNLGQDKTVRGIVRRMSAIVDPKTNTGSVDVALEYSPNTHVGQFASGSFQKGKSKANTVPLTSMVSKDGFHYVFVVQPDYKVKQTKVTIGRQYADRLEILSGLEPMENVVVSGADFLKDGDYVKIKSNVKSLGVDGPSLIGTDTPAVSGDTPAANQIIPQSDSVQVQRPNQGATEPNQPSQPNQPTQPQPSQPAPQNEGNKTPVQNNSTPSNTSAPRKSNGNASGNGSANEGKSEAQPGPDRRGDPGATSNTIDVKPKVVHPNNQKDKVGLKGNPHDGDDIEVLNEQTIKA